MTRTFYYTDEKSDKFWTIEISGDAYTVNFGKVGTAGQAQTKKFADEAACRKAAEKLIVEKTKKGYMEQVTTDKKTAYEEAKPLFLEKLNAMTEELRIKALGKIQKGRYDLFQVHYGDDERPSRWDFSPREEYDTHMNALVPAIFDTGYVRDMRIALTVCRDKEGKGIIFKNPEIRIQFHTDYREVCLDAEVLVEGISDFVYEDMKDHINPILKEWANSLIMGRPYGDVFDVWLNVTTLVVDATKDNEYNHSSFQTDWDTPRQQQWRTHLVEAIRNESYKQWPVIESWHLTEAINLVEEVGGDAIAEYLTHFYNKYGSNTITYGFEWERNANRFLEYVEQKSPHYKNVDDIVKVLTVLNELPRQKFDGFRRGLKLAIDAGYQSEAPLAENSGQVVSFIKDAVLNWEIRQKKLLGNRPATHPAVTAELVIGWICPPLHPGEIVIGPGEVDRQTVPCDVSLLLNQTTMADIAVSIKDWIQQKVDTAKLGDLYYPRLQCNISFHETLDSFGKWEFREKFIVENPTLLAQWNNTIEQYIRQELYKGDTIFTSRNSKSVSLQFLHMFETFPATIADDFFAEILKQLKLQKVKLDDTGLSKALKEYVESLLAMPLTEVGKFDYWAKLSLFIVENGGNSSARKLLKRLYGKGNPIAMAFLKDYKAWQEADFWSDYDRDNQMQPAARMTKKEGMLYKAKKNDESVAIVLLDENDESYQQVLEYLIKTMPKLRKEDGNADIDLSVQFINQPLFPAVPLHYSPIQHDEFTVAEKQAESQVNAPVDNTSYLDGFLRKSDLAFFACAVRWESLHPLVEKYARKMLKTKLRTDTDGEFATPAAAPAIIALALTGKKYLDLVKEYARVADDEHEEVQLCLIPALLHRYGTDDKEVLNTCMTLAASSQNGEEYLELFPALSSIKKA